MNNIFFTVQNDTIDDLDVILSSLQSNFSKALKSRFRHMCLIIRHYKNKFTKIYRTNTIKILWRMKERGGEFGPYDSGPVTKPKSNASLFLEKQFSNITTLLNR